ncbi:hypothetical protein ACJIZ3_009998 [Penstemon smallii]|uniref:Uncharacterized protein n=1 Tax=Penstemon smallii TaxID=265156 RepID=A0ABD3TE37_9LAMI
MDETQIHQFVLAGNSTSHVQAGFQAEKVDPRSCLQRSRLVVYVWGLLAKARSCVFIISMAASADWIMITGWLPKRRSMTGHPYFVPKDWNER